MSTANADNHNNSNREMTIESADILRLIAAHLTECGLYEACRVLREESGVGSAGCLRAVHANFSSWASRGEWGTILESLSTLDLGRLPPSAVLLMADVHEMAILELAEAGELRLAFATLRLVEDELDKLPADEEAGGPSNKKTKTNEYVLSRKRDLEQRLAALVSLRNLKEKDASQQQQLPPDFYGKDTTKQQRRDDIGQRLADTIPVVPPSRLTSLLQQALKWQAYTGQLPRVQNHWPEDETIPENTNEDIDIAEYDLKDFLIKNDAQLEEGQTFDSIMEDEVTPTTDRRKLESKTLNTNSIKYMDDSIYKMGEICNNVIGFYKDFATRMDNNKNKLKLTEVNF